MRAVLTSAALVSAILFPWPFTVLLALVASLTEPLVPLAVGILADTLYYSAARTALPFFTLVGVIGTIISLVVRSRLSASIIQE